MPCSARVSITHVRGLATLSAPLVVCSIFVFISVGDYAFMVIDNRVIDTWKAVLGKLQIQVTRPSYDTWLKGTVGLSCISGEMVIGVPNAFVAEMLDRRMHSLISKALADVLGKEHTLRFEIVGSVPPAGHDHAESHPSESPLGQPEERQPTQAMTVRGTRINPRYTFESFVVGKSNELAHAASLAVSENPGVSYNPLFIYSGVGLGKTHLLNAIGLRLSSKGLSLEYATTEEFTNGYIKAIREGHTDDFRDRYRSADVLLLDDIQFIIGKEQTQEGFFHTFNSLHAASRQVVITCDRPATHLMLLEDRIRSRLTGGLVVDIQPPALETRQAILGSKADAIGVHFPVEVLEFLAEKVDSNIRDLEGCLNRISAYAQLTSSSVSLEIAERCVNDVLHSAGARRRVSEIAVLETVCGYFAIDQASIRGRGRDKPTTLARQVAMYLLREEAKLPLSAIGRFLGGKDHTTVLHAHQRISNQITSNSHLRKDLANLRDELAKL